MVDLTGDDDGFGPLLIGGEMGAMVDLVAEDGDDEGAVLSGGGGGAEEAGVLLGHPFGPD